MIITGLLAVLFGFITCFFVVFPLLNQGRVPTGEDAFSGNTTLVQTELATLVARKNQMIAILCGASAQEGEFKDRTQEECLYLLVKTCLKLKRSGLPYLGLLFSFVTLFSAFTPRIYAQQEPSPQPQLDIRIPQGVAVSNSSAVRPRVNQFILYPEQGALFVQYFALLQPSHAKTEDILLPLPLGATDLKITSPQTALVKPLETVTPPPHGSAREGIVVTVPAEGGVIAIRAQFKIPAPWGEARWTPTTNALLPGMTLIVMPTFSGLLRTILEPLKPDLNLWPPRLLGIPQGFERELIAEVFNPDHPLVKQINPPPKQQMIRLLRAGGDDATYPTFVVTGLVPDRSFLLGIATFFGCLLFGMTGFFWIKKNAVT